MDVETEKLCLEELTHLLCDAKKKVTIKEVSNNWNVSLKQSEVVLTKWLSEYKGNDAVSKEHLIRGNDLNGNCVISVVRERKLEVLGKLCPNYCSSLYSLEFPSNGSKRLSINNVTESKVITLQLRDDKRDTAVEPEPSVQVETKDIKKEVKIQATTSTTNGNAAKKSFFGSASQVKKEPKSPIKSLSNEITVKQEKKSPARKDGPKSVASFFSKPSAKPTPNGNGISSGTSSVTVRKTESTAKSTSSNKRTFSDTNTSATEEVPEKPKEVKEPNKKKVKIEAKKPATKAAANRSRIMAICDSSSDDEDLSKKTRAKTPDSKSDEDVKIKEKENTTPEKTTSTVKPEDNAAGEGSRRRRIKKKKMITKTFEDEDGYINTVQEMVEYSCSEEEDNLLQSQAPQTSTKSEASTTNQTNKNKKKVLPPVAKTQKSILTFFSKK